MLRLYRKMWLNGDVLQYFEEQLRVLEKREEDLAIARGKKPKKWLIENYEWSYSNK